MAYLCGHSLPVNQGGNMSVVVRWRVFWSYFCKRCMTEWRFKIYSYVNMLTFLIYHVISIFIHVYMHAYICAHTLRRLPLVLLSINFFCDILLIQNGSSVYVAISVDLLFSWCSKDDQPPRPSGNTQPEGGKDKGNSYAINQLNLCGRDSCFESPTVSQQSPNVADWSDWTMNILLVYTPDNWRC